MKFTKTEAGQLAFKERSRLFSARQRAAFILFDGRKTVASILEATAILGLTQVDVDYLVGQGFLVPVEEPAAPEPVRPLAPELPVTPAMREAGDEHGVRPVNQWTMF